MEASCSFSSIVASFGLGFFSMLIIADSDLMEMVSSLIISTTVL